MARQHNSAETREKIIESAVKLFYERGYSKTTLEDIVKGANLTRGAFYWNFQSKKDLLDEIEHRYEEFYRNIYSNVKEDPSARTTLRDLLYKNLSTKLRPNQYAIMIRYKIESAIELKDLIVRQQAMDEMFIDFIAAQIQRGIAQGEFLPSTHSRSLAQYIYTFLIGFDTYMLTHSIHESGSLPFSAETVPYYIDLLLQPLVGFAVPGGELPQV